MDSEGLMNALTGFHHLTDLYIYFDGCSSVCLAPLTRIPTLRKLRIPLWAPSYRMTDNDIATVRALGHLELFYMFENYFTVDNLQRIFATPHTLEWQSMNRIESVVVARLLPALPSLTQLAGPSHVFPADVMGALPHLTTLIMTGTNMLDRALSNCHNLTCLKIVLDDASTLEWACTPSLRTSLRTLKLIRFREGFRMDHTQLRHLFHLTHLNTLTLDADAFAATLMESPELAALRPPSAALQKLQSLIIT
jgi:hypothetical protein